jgi:hypothetical protein
VGVVLGEKSEAKRGIHPKVAQLFYFSRFGYPKAWLFFSPSLRPSGPLVVVSRTPPADAERERDNDATTFTSFW